MEKQRLFFFTTLVLCVLYFAGCGGGGSDNTPPNAAFTIVADGLTVNADATASSDAQDGASVLVSWDWGDGQTTVFSAEKTASHTYANGGTYSVWLQVKDSGGLTVSQMQQVTVSADNSSPSASFTVTPSSGTTSTTFQFNASNSDDTEDAPAALQVRWDWEDDGLWDTDFSTTKIITHKFIVPGTYAVKLQVKDTGGLYAVTSTDVLVLPDGTAPTAAFTISPSSGNTGTTFNVDAGSSSDAEDSASDLQVRWDWENDGTWDTSYSTAKTAAHNYPSPGTYTIKLEVKDTSGLTGVTTRTVVVTSSVSISITPQTKTIAAGRTKQFIATVTGTSNTEVSWSVLNVSEEPIPGAITSEGLLTAPSTYGKYYIDAISSADQTKTARATVYVVAPSLIAFNRAVPTYGGYRLETYTMELDGSNPTKVLDHGYSSMSPDGKAMAIQSIDSYISIVNIDGSPTTGYGSFGRGNAPSFSPDGRKLVFSNIDQYLVVVNVDGTERRQYGVQYCQTPIFNQDGTKVVFRLAPSYSDIAIMDVASGSVTNVTNDPDYHEYNPVFSPDGTKIAYHANRQTMTGQSGVYLINSDGTGKQFITTGGNGGIAFSPDGKTLLIASGEGTKVYLRYVDLGGGLSGPATDGEYDSHPSWRGWTDVPDALPTERKKRQ
ncbi:MAG: PKD domain-containing protein [Armatimonadota bacterium]